MGRPAKCRTLTLLFAIVTVFGGQAQGATPGMEPKIAQGKVLESNRARILSSVREILGVSGKAARLSYAARCEHDQSDPLPFPQMSVQAVPGGETGLAAIRAMFKNDKTAVVTEKTPDIISIQIGTFPDAILQTKISVLNLTPTEQYNVVPAIDEGILGNSDVVNAMNKLGLDVPTLLEHYQPALPGNRPHLPPSMNNVTLDQVLDQVAKTFGGIVLYGVCSESGLMYISYF